MLVIEGGKTQQILLNLGELFIYLANGKKSHRMILYTELADIVIQSIQEL